MEVTSFSSKDLLNIRIRGYDGFPCKLPKYANDGFVLIEVCSQISELNKRCKERKKSGVSFPIGLSFHKCGSSFDALNIERDVAKYAFQFFEFNPLLTVKILSKIICNEDLIFIMYLNWKIIGPTAVMNFEERGRNLMKLSLR